MKILILSFLVSSLSFAQGVYESLNRPDLGTLRQQGKLVSVGIEVGQPIKIFVVGKEEAKLNLADLKLTVRQVKPYPGKILSTNRDGDYFTITDPVDLNKATDIEVTTKIDNKTETLNFTIENKPR